MLRFDVMAGRTRRHSGATQVNAAFSGNHASGSSASDSIAITISAANNWIVAGLGSANTLTTSVGNSRQGTTTSNARIRLQDNTAATENTSVTNTATLTSAAWTAVGIEIGNAGKARTEQDVLLSINSPTSSKARVEQDVLLSINQPTTSKARVEQDVLIVIVGNNLLLRKHVQRYITQRRKKPKNKKHWGHFQNAALLAAQPYTPIVERGVKRVIRHRDPNYGRQRVGRFLNEALLVATPFVPRLMPLMVVKHRAKKAHLPRHIHMQRAMGGSKRRQPFVFVSC